MLRGGRIFYGAFTSFLSLCLTSILYLNTTIVVQTYHILVIVDMDEKRRRGDYPWIAPR